MRVISNQTFGPYGTRFSISYKMILEYAPSIYTLILSFGGSGLLFLLSTRALSRIQIPKIICLDPQPLFSAYWLLMPLYYHSFLYKMVHKKTLRTLGWLLRIKDGFMHGTYIKWSTRPPRLIWLISWRRSVVWGQKSLKRTKIPFTQENAEGHPQPKVKSRIFGLGVYEDFLSKWWRIAGGGGEGVEFKPSGP